MSETPWQYAVHRDDGWQRFETRHDAASVLVPMLRNHPWLDVKHAATWALPFTETNIE